MNVFYNIKSMKTKSFFSVINDSLLQMSEAQKQKGAAAKQSKKAVPAVAQSFKRMLK